VIPDEEVERVREAADLVGIIGESVTLKRAGTAFRGPCPFHQGKNPNFSVDPRRRIYHCFKCGESGDVFTYLRKRYGMDWPSAVRHVAERSGIVLREVSARREGPDPREGLWEVNAAAEDWFRRVLRNESSGTGARDYLAQRDVSPDLADRFGLGFAPRDGSLRAHLATLGFDDARQLDAGLLVRKEGNDALLPRLVQRIIDEGIAQLDLSVVIETAVLMITFALIGMVGGVGCAIYAIKTGQAFGADLRRALFRHVQSLSFGNLDELETGKLITRLTSDVTQVQELIMMLLRVMVRSPLLLLGSLIMAILTSPQLALLFVVLIPIVLAFLVWIINKSFPMFGAVQQKLDGINTVMQENLAGVRVVKAFVRGEYENGRFAQANDAWMSHNLTAVRTIAVTMPFMMLVLNMGVVAAFWLGGVQVNAGGLQVGQIVALINYLMQTLMSLMMVSMLVMRVSRAEATAVRVLEVF
jgi:hypothetical protein